LINERERQIAKRVRQVRYSNQLSQPAFARAIRISLDQAASIEYARTPLTLGIAERIAIEYDVSLSWLADGRGRMNPCGGLITRLFPTIKPDSLLSAAWSRHVHARLKSEFITVMFDAAAILIRKSYFPGGLTAEQVAHHFHRALDETLFDLPDAGREKLLSFMIRNLAAFEADWELGERHDPGNKRMIGKKEALTETSKVRNDRADMKSALGRLLDDTRKLTRARGTKSKLANALGVPQARLSEWLAGKYAPAGEAALRLRELVDAPENWLK